MCISPPIPPWPLPLLISMRPPEPPVLDVPLPLWIKILPPALLVEVELPAATVKFPPIPLEPSPTPTYMDPPLPPVADPVDIAIDPEAPQLDVPVLKINAPDAPAPPESAVAMLVEPLVVYVPFPLRISIFPPNEPNPRPATRVIFPPRPKLLLVPDPAVMLTAPPDLRAAVLPPAVRTTLPPLPELPVPILTVKLPPAPLFESPVSMAIEPVDPRADVPVRSNIAPLTPFKPEFAVTTRNAPLELFSPLPVFKNTDPPVAPAPSPARNSIFPPRPPFLEFPFPAPMLMEPPVALFAVVAPAVNDMEPPFSSPPPLPTANVMLPP